MRLQREHFRRLRRFAGAALFLATLAVPAGAASADETLTVTTPYPSVEAQPGSEVQLEFDVASAKPDVVDLEVQDLPDGWSATLRGGGFVVHQVTSGPLDDPDNEPEATLSVDVAPRAEPGEYPIRLVATDTTGGKVTSVVTMVVAEQVDSGIGLTADFPVLTGEPGGSLNYTLTVTNNTPAEQTFTFDPSAPQGWTVSASPAAQAAAGTVTVEAGETTDVSVDATAPESAKQGEYPIKVGVRTGNGQSGQIELTAVVSGTAEMSFTTANEQLNVKGEADSEKRVPMVIANSGSAAMEDVKLAGTAPTDWEVSFDPESIDALQPGETAQVNAVITPSPDAVAGDYSMNVRASAGSLSQTVDLRYTVEGSTTLGVFALGVIAVAVIGLVLVFWRFGRR